MMKYRDHRGGLQESMETAREFSTEKDLLKYLNGNLPAVMPSYVELQFTYFGYDKRVDWDTWFVSARFENDPIFYLAGFSDAGEFKVIQG